MPPDNVVPLRSDNHRTALHRAPAHPPLVFRTFWLACGWALVALVIYLSLTPQPLQLNVEAGDKFGHALAYLTLMSWFANLYENRPRRAQLAVGFVAMGIALEFVQRWTGYRTFEVADMAAGATGVVLGWILAAPRGPNYLRLAEKVFRP
jgi:VanZ family protein